MNVQRRPTTVMEWLIVTIVQAPLNVAVGRVTLETG